MFGFCCWSRCKWQLCAISGGNGMVAVSHTHTHTYWHTRTHCLTQLYAQFGNRKMRFKFVTPFFRPPYCWQSHTPPVSSRVYSMQCLTSWAQCFRLPFCCVYLMKCILSECWKTKKTHIWNKTAGIPAILAVRGVFICQRILRI